MLCQIIKRDRLHSAKNIEDGQRGMKIRQGTDYTGIELEGLSVLS